ncbi:MAG: hypothetical protein SFV51_02335 [Bryobacteraceae bacterium]|nr:hypothetical protein [Bryobacteraceae bacterium]
MADGEAGIQPLERSPIEEYIAPANLLGLVRNTAPFLFPAIESLPAPGPLIHAGQGPAGYLEVLRGAEAVESTEDYFALCIACHHATVGTFVPTDVDSKIRGLLWRQTRTVEAARRMFEFTLRSMTWSIEGVSLKAVGPVSGHNGEQLSVLLGALGSFHHFRDHESAAAAADAVDAELRREAAAFDASRDLDRLRLSAILTHNSGDVDQGISFWPKSGPYAEARARFGRLAHENTTPYGGAFQRAAAIYKRAMACEGHRNYPLRAVKALRQSPDLLTPFGPFLDDWGQLVARHPALSDQDRADTIAALLHGCRTIPNQRGYYRALAGMVEALGGRLEAILRLMPNRARAEWKDPRVRKQVAVPRASFESMMRKMS